MLWSLREWGKLMAKLPAGKFEGVVLGKGVVSFKKESQPIGGVTAAVESAGEMRKKATLGRVLLLGGIGGLIFKKTVDDRELYLSIDGPQYSWVVPVDPKKGLDARQFAALINTAAKGA